MKMASMCFNIRISFLTTLSATPPFLQGLPGQISAAPLKSARHAFADLSRQYSHRSTLSSFRPQLANEHSLAWRRGRQSLQESCLPSITKVREIEPLTLYITHFWTHEVYKRNHAYAGNHLPDPNSPANALNRDSTRKYSDEAKEPLAQ